MEELKRRVLSRFGMSNRPMGHGFFAVFGFGPNPHLKSMTSILEETAGGALNKDADTIAEDFHRVFERERNLIDVKSQ